MKIIQIACFLGLSISLNAQLQQSIHKNSNITNNYIGNIDSIRFDATNSIMEIVFNGGAITAHPIADILNATFYNLPTTVHTCGYDSIHNPDRTYGVAVDQEGNEYKTINIGNQKWMAENLKTSIFQNGDPIAEFVNYENDSQFIDWVFSSEPYWTYYLTDSSYECPFGKLYSWHAIDDPRNVCPAGWHVPNAAEWTELINFVDPSQPNDTLANNSALALRSLAMWPTYVEFANSNSSGFSSLPSQGAWGNLFDTYPNMSEYWSRGLNENNYPITIQMLEYDSTAKVDFFSDIYYWINARQITQSVRCISDTLNSGDLQIPGCMNQVACNYNPQATIDDGSCRIVGTTCNDYFFDTQNDVWTADCNCEGQLVIGAPTSCGAENVHNQNLTYGSMSDQEGNSYKTIIIGAQEWMAENLATGTYQNGDPISATFTGAQSGECANYMDDASNICPNGKLYNWYAVSDTRNVCPIGWHVPDDAEWSTLINFLDPFADGGLNYGNVAGGKMKSVPSNLNNGVWLSNVGATNSSGFSALPSGLWQDAYDYLGYLTAWWSLSPFDDANANSISVGNSDAAVQAFPFPKNYGASVRCVRD